jgi:hypothetical protein
LLMDCEPIVLAKICRNVLIVNLGRLCSELVLSTPSRWWKDLNLRIFSQSEAEIVPRIPLIGGFVEESFWKPIGEEKRRQLRAWPWHAVSILTNHESVSAVDPSHWWICSGKLLEANRRGEAGTAQGLALARSLSSNQSRVS